MERARLPVPALFLFLVACLLCASSSEASAKTELKSCRLQSSAQVHANGAQISREGYDASSWYKVTIPATVLAGLVQNGVYEDPFYGKNLQKISESPFETPWWYRCEFPYHQFAAGSTALLTFKGLNYKANVWLNGKQIGTSDKVVGSFRYFDFDVTGVLSSTGASNNVLAVEVYRPKDSAFPPTNKDTDLAITFVDWAPPPPDNNMGLWREVELSFVPGKVSVRYPSVATVLSDADSSTPTAHLEVLAELTNWDSRNSIQGELFVVIEGVVGPALKKAVTLRAGETQQVVLDNSTYPAALNVKNPKLWWPWQMGDQNMQNITMVFIASGGKISDGLSTRFGIRQITSELFNSEDPAAAAALQSLSSPSCTNQQEASSSSSLAKGNRLYRVNGKPILVRGAGWAPDLFLRENATRVRSELTYVKDMNLNTIRMEGKMPIDAFFDIADEMGLLLMPGWCCCDAWQHWDLWSQEVYQVAMESLRSQVKRQRIHPSLLVFLYASDELPPADVEKGYLTVFEEERWPADTLASASDRTSSITGPTGVKMSGPYAWVPPNYWGYDQLGGAFGFLTEGGPGSNPMPFESFSQTVPKDKLWPINDYWDWHCGNPAGLFRNLRFFTPPLDMRYGDATSAEDYLEKAQVVQYEAQRAMFEGYSRNKYVATGLIQWMLNNAFPQMIWHMYDYYLNPAGAYFGAKKGNELLHIQYNYRDRSIWLVNSVYTPQRNLRALAEIYSLNGTQVWTHQKDVDTLAADGVQSVFNVPDIRTIGTTYFLRLSLLQSKKASNHVKSPEPTVPEEYGLVSRNVYWLSTKVDVLDWSNSTFYITYCTSYADFSALETLPPVKLITQMRSAEKNKNVDNEMESHVSIKNPTNHIAFFVRARIVRNNDGQDVLPILWDDNYITLLPGEAVVLTARYDKKDLKGAIPTLLIEVWNNISGGK